MQELTYISATLLNIKLYRNFIECLLNTWKTPFNEGSVSIT